MFFTFTPHLDGRSLTWELFYSIQEAQDTFIHNWYLQEHYFEDSQWSLPSDAAKFCNHSFWLKKEMLSICKQLKKETNKPQVYMVAGHFHLTYWWVRYACIYSIQKVSWTENTKSLFSLECIQMLVYWKWYQKWYYFNIFAKKYAGYNIEKKRNQSHRKHNS